MAGRKRKRAEADEPAGQQSHPAEQSSPSGADRLGEILESDRWAAATQQAAAQFAAELKADALTVRPFAAAVDTRTRRLQFLSPSVLAVYGERPTTRPEQLLHDAVARLLTGLLAANPGEEKPVLPGTGSGPRHLQLSGRASAVAVEDPSRAAVIRAYIRAAVESGDPGEGVQIRYSDGSCVTVVLTDSPDLTIPPVTQPDPSADSPFPKNVHEVFLDLRKRMIPPHQGVVGMMQSMLDGLAGRRGKTIEENQAAAATVNSLADDYGIALLYDRHPVVVRVVKLKRDDGGSFQLRQTGSEQKAVKTRMAFPALVAVSRAALIEGVLNAFSSADE